MRPPISVDPMYPNFPPIPPDPALLRPQFVRDPEGPEPGAAPFEFRPDILNPQYPGEAPGWHAPMKPGYHPETPWIHDPPHPIFNPIDPWDYSPLDPPPPPPPPPLPPPRPDGYDPQGRPFYRPWNPDFGPPPPYYNPYNPWWGFS